MIYRHQVLKQADVVLAMFLRGDEFPADVQRRNFDYYDPITTGDSSLSACVQAIMAAEVGHADLACRYFRRVAVPRHRRHPRQHGRRRAHRQRRRRVGGLVHGFAGVRDTVAPTSVAPRLPAGWSAMRFSLHRRGSDIAIAVDPTGATVTVESGGPVPILGNGVITAVPPGGSLRIVS